MDNKLVAAAKQAFAAMNKVRLNNQPNDVQDDMSKAMAQLIVALGEYKVVRPTVHLTFYPTPWLPENAISCTFNHEIPESMTLDSVVNEIQNQWYNIGELTYLITIPEGKTLAEYFFDTYLIEKGFRAVQVEHAEHMEFSITDG